MRSLFLLIVFLSFVSMGIFAPFIAALGYVWVDIVSPQRLAYSLIRGVSLSQYMAIATLVLYLFVDRKMPPRITKLFVLLCVWAIWITLTTTWARVPEDAWLKWDWAFKGIAFSAFLPFLFRTRVQIEAFVLVIIFAATCHFLPAATKTALGSGGYRSLALLSDNNRGLAESSTLALFSVMLIPLMNYARIHSQIFSDPRIRNILFFGLTATVLIAVVGTFSRTGLLALMVYGGLIILMRDHKIRNISAILVVAAVALFVSSADWKNRMGTIANYQTDSSATGRIAVWLWTIDFALENPLGGGFEVHAINEVEVVTSTGPVRNLFDPNERIVQKKGKAFHSIYFEVLGEHGFVGLGLYLTLFATTMLALWRMSREKVKDPSTQWVPELATALMLSMAIYLAGGAFIGIAFQPYSYYWIGLTIALQQYGLRAGSPARAGKTIEPVSVDQFRNQS